MDPFSADGELLNLQSFFYQGQYQQVIDFDTKPLSAANLLPARILALRAKIALGQSADVLSELEAATDEVVPELEAAKAFAQYSAGQTESGLAAIEKLAEEKSDNPTVQLLGGIVLQAEGKSEEALAILAKHQGSLEAVALIVQIHLQQNRTELALKEVQAARRWAQDSLLINIAASWAGLRVGGEQYQSAFYVYEEIASAPATSAPLSLTAQAVAELHLGRLPEAEAALTQALEKDAGYAEALANLLVLSVIAGKSEDERAEIRGRLETAESGHALLRDLREKSEAFDKGAAKYLGKLAAA